MQLPDNLLAPLEIALNRYLGEDDEALAQLASLAGQGDRLLGLKLRDLGLEFYMRPHAGGLQVLAHVMSETEQPPTATVTASLPVLARLLVSDDKGRELVLGGEIGIDGDSEFARDLLGILRDADFDAEEWLSRYIGDVAAFRVGQFMRGLLRQGRQAADSIGRDTLRLLRDDGGDLVDGAEVREWMAQVDILRADVERIEARIKRMDGQSREGQ